VRIALLTHEPFHPPSGGGSAAALYLVGELRRRQHTIDVFGPRIPDQEKVERDFGITFRPFTTWPMGRTTPWRTLKYLAYPPALARLVSRTMARGARYDLVLAQHSISAVAASRLKSRFGIPTVLNLLDCLTGFMETWPALLMPRPVARALVRYEMTLPRRGHADAVLTVSDPLRERIVAAGFPARRTHAIYYGFDARLFRARPRPTQASRPPQVVMHGSFDHHHLGPIAHRAVIGIAQRRPDVRFRFIGPRTPAVSRLLQAIQAAAPGAQLETTGFVPYEKIPPLLAEADVGITPYEPSTGTHCAFVAKTVEYLALGMPVVSTPLESAVRYYAGLEGIRFSRPNGDGFADAVLDWLALPAAERRARVEPARVRVVDELDWPAVCGRAAQVVEATLAATTHG
jgi:glycosyltransferase involved in cell wall biosynthesis